MGFGSSKTPPKCLDNSNKFLKCSILIISILLHKKDFSTPYPLVFKFDKQTFPFSTSKALNKNNGGGGGELLLFKLYFVKKLSTVRIRNMQYSDLGHKLF